MSDENGNGSEENEANDNDAEETSEAEENDSDNGAADDDSDAADEEIAEDPSDRYERTEKLGSGGLGTVYRATQHRLSRDVAIKEVRNIFEVFADVDREGIIERFAEVTEAQAALAHPNVVRVFDLETDEEYPYAVTEYSQAGTLRRFIEDDDRSLRAALKYFLQVLHALSAAHDADLVHGGIKPENVLIDDAGNAVVTDFGHSGVVDVSEGSNQVYVGVGTVNYMPPEQFDDPTAATESSDLYSAGIMFYEMLTGKVPGRRSPMPSSFHADIPDAIDDVFDRMTMDRVEDRFESIDAVLEAIYSSNGVLDILDRRSAVLFHGNPLDGGSNPAADPGVILGDDVSSESSEEQETSQQEASQQEASAPKSSQESDVIERGGGSADSEDGDPNDRQSEEDEGATSDESDEEASEDETADTEEADEAEEIEEEEEEAGEEAADEEEKDEEDEVLDKLEDYGELFEDED